MIEALIHDFVENGELASSRQEGRYLITDFGGRFLYDDGVIRASLLHALEEASPYWPNKSEAETFFTEWKLKWKNQSI